MIAHDLKEWRKYRGWSRERAIKEFTGESRPDIWTHWETGVTPIPSWLAAAITNYEILEIMEVFDYDD